MAKKLVVGIGNILFQDDGMAIHALQELARANLPEGVVLIEAGTDVFGIISHLPGANKLIIIDSLKGGCVPGTIYRMEYDEILTEQIFAVPQAGFSLHQESVLDVLRIVSISEKLPQTVVLGVEPKLFDLGLELSPEVRDALPLLVDLVLKEVNLPH